MVNRFCVDCLSKCLYRYTLGVMVLVGGLSVSPLMATVGGAARRPRASVTATSSGVWKR